MKQLSLCESESCLFVTASVHFPLTYICHYKIHLQPTCTCVCVFAVVVKNDADLPC